MEQTWKRKEYDSWDEAFRGLSPLARQQSVRVAGYTQVLFVWACKLRYGAKTRKGDEQMRGKYADVAYKCGLYHQIGKALVPPEYQIWQNDFSDEEEAVYRKYTTDGRLLVSTLQNKGVRAREKRRGELYELPTKNVSSLMIREACEMHMERWDGSGFPAGLKGNAISPIAQVVGLAKELDRISAETKSENPFELAFDTLLSEADVKWSGALIAVLKAARDDCFNVYRKYIAYTRTLPTTVPLVVKREDRAMGLKYRPMASDDKGAIRMYEAIPWFGGILDNPEETEGISEVYELLARTNLTEDTSWYFMYEATDTLYRIKNCKLDLDGVVLNMLPGFYSLPTQLQKFNELFERQPVNKQSLILTMPENVYKNATKTMLEVVKRYIRAGITIMLDDCHPEGLDTDALFEYGIQNIRIAPELYCNKETAEWIEGLNEKGFKVYGKNADSADVLSWLVSCKVICSSGTITGLEVNENELVRDTLMRESV